MTTDSNPSAAPNAPLGEAAGAGAALEVTWGRALSIWWSLMWRTVLASMLVGGVVGALLGALLAVAGFETGSIVTITQIAGSLLGIPVGVAMLRHILKKRWSNFRIVLVATAH